MQMLQMPLVSISNCPFPLVTEMAAWFAPSPVSERRHLKHGLIRRTSPNSLVLKPSLPTASPANNDVRPYLQYLLTHVRRSY